VGIKPKQQASKSQLAIYNSGCKNQIKTIVSDRLGVTRYYLISHDFLALGFIEALREKGIKVPDDRAVVGLGNFLASEQVLIPHLTTIDRRQQERGAKAGELLFACLEKAEQTGWQRCILEPELVVRETSVCKQ
jgi:DNA-binding LacI/PurR family transcriptional regulator